MESNGLTLHSYSLGDGVVAFSTTRHGGYSAADNYNSFNINPFCGDSAEHVAQCREALCRELGIADERLVLPHQVHGVETRIISAEYCSLPEQVRTMIVDGVDAVMTAVPGLCIGVSTADCVPVLLHDPVHRAVCAVHAGWRGTLARVTHKAVVDMRAAFGTAPADLHAVVGPCISLANFEVGDEVYEQFAAADFNLDAASVRREKWHIDLPEINRQLLVQAGLDEANIAMSGICTYDRCDDFFSARRLGIESGRIFNGVMLSTDC